MDIIESNIELDMLLSNLETSHVFIDPVYCDQDKHACNNELSLIFFYIFKTDTTWCLPINHNEGICVPNALDRVKDTLSNSMFYLKLVKDKKSITQSFGIDCNFIDIDIFNFLKTGLEPKEKIYTNAHNFIWNNFKNLDNLNKCVPIYKHAKIFLSIVESIRTIDIKDINDDRGFLFFNNTSTKIFSKL